MHVLILNKTNTLPHQNVYFISMIYNTVTPISSMKFRFGTLYKECDNGEIT